jgi:hypothetical protein
MASFFAGSVLMALLAVAPYAANLGSVSGIITDPSGQPLPGARVVLTSNDQQPRTVVTDEQGRYRIARLPPDRYRLEARMSGFLTKPTEIFLERGEDVDWGGALLLGSIPDDRSVEQRVLRLTGPNAIDCGRHLDAVVDGDTLRHAVECGTQAASAHRPFSLILQYSTSGHWAFEGLMATSDGQIRSFTYLRNELEISSCPHPAVMSHPIFAEPHIGVSCETGEPSRSTSYVAFIR